MVYIRLLGYFALFVSLERDHNGLLEHVRCLNDRVHVKLLGIFDSLDAVNFRFQHRGIDCLDVWVPRAKRGGVAVLSAAHAPQMAVGITLLFLGFIAVLILVLGLVLLELATLCLLVRLSAAPPHLSTPFALMQLAAPIKVFFFVVLCVAIFACFYACANFSFALDKLLNPRFVLIALFH